MPHFTLKCTVTVLCVRTPDFIASLLIQPLFWEHIHRSHWSGKSMQQTFPCEHTQSIYEMLLLVHGELSCTFHLTCNLMWQMLKVVMLCRDGGYGADRGYGGGGGGGGSYADAGYGAERGGAYSSGYANGGGGGAAPYDRGYDDRGYGGRDAYSRGLPAPVREGAYSRPGPEREYARPAARAPGPYERPMAGLPPR